MTLSMGLTSYHFIPLKSPSTPNTPQSQPGLIAKHTPLSDLLNLPMTAGSKPPPKTGRARVLTSNECLSLLKEKEEKVKQETLEKEKRQQERLAKKKEKEEQQKKAGKQNSKSC